ncbi:MAG: F0F1 ATP synthase subunit B [Patescibacteria group bacterium]|jgi:F-type H+-transporting ATPase subunit b
MELFSALGIDYKILIAQVINFAVLGFILYKVGYKPILKFVQDRTATIELGVKQAEEAKLAITAATADQQNIIKQAKVAAQKLLDEAKEQSLVQGQQLVERSKVAASKVVEQAKHDIRLEHDKMMQGAKAELSELVLLATEKILKQKLTAEADKSLIEKTIHEI